MSETPKDERQNRRIAEFKESHPGEWLMLRTREGVDLEMPCDDAVTDNFLRHGSFEGNLCALLQTLLLCPATVIDLGANVGFFACFLAAHQPGSRIVAVEPNPMLIEALRRNLARNGVAATVLPAALGVSRGRACLTFPTNRPSRGTLGSLPQSARFSSILEVEIDMITWDEVFDACGNDRVRILKMDLEGFDVKALVALKPEQIERVDHIICEFSEKRLTQCGSAREDIHGMASLGQFEPWAVDCAAVPLRLTDVRDFPRDAQTLWLRRRDSKRTRD